MEDAGKFLKDHWIWIAGGVAGIALLYYLSGSGSAGTSAGTAGTIDPTAAAQLSAQSQANQLQAQLAANQLAAQSSAAAAATAAQITLAQLAAHSTDTANGNALAVAMETLKNTAIAQNQTFAQSLITLQQQQELVAQHASTVNAAAQSQYITAVGAAAGSIGTAEANVIMAQAQLPAAALTASGKLAGDTITAAANITANSLLAQGQAVAGLGAAVGGIGMTVSQTGTTAATMVGNVAQANAIQSAASSASLFGLGSAAGGIAKLVTAL